MRPIRPTEQEAQDEGRCSCPQSLWYLEILKELEEIFEDNLDDAVNELIDMRPEIERAIKFGIDNKNKKG